MKKTFLPALALALLVSDGAWRVAAAAGPAAAQPQQVTLYSPNKYRHDQSRAYFSFQRGALARRGESWDVGYGTLYVGEYHDWFSSSSARGNRSVIRDLGPRNWGDPLVVPVVEPLPKLKAGEQRRISIDASGADGRDGERGRDAVAPGTNGTTAAGEPNNAFPPGDPRNSGPVNLPPSLLRASRPSPPPPTPRREPTVDPMFVKAVVGHMYVIHVVDDTSDYYALFRVESLERGDNCTITWAVVPAPDAGAGRD